MYPVSEAFLRAVQETEKESEAVWHNQAECRKYLEAGKAAGTRKEVER